MDNERYESAVSEERHHSHHHHRHHSHSGREYQNKYANDRKQGNMAAEVAKERKKTIWKRSAFLSIIFAGIILLIVMIFTIDENTSLSNIRIFNRSESYEQLTNEIDELKKENMQLEYELEKYKKKYGELEEKTE